MSDLYGQSVPTPMPVSGVPNPPAAPTRPTTQPSKFMDPQQEAMFRQMANFLQSMGLSSLFTIDNGRPSGWLWDVIVEQDWTTEEELMIALEARPEFRERFKVMFEQREQAARGEPVQILTPAEIRAYEQQAMQLMRAAGMPPQFYDHYSDFQELMRKKISIQRLNERVNQSWDRVATLPPQVRQLFGEYYGIQGDAVLAATFLDPDYVDANLDRMSRAAAVGGVARMQGFELERSKAEQLADMGASEQDAAKLAQVGRLRPLFTETITERTDLQAGREGVDAAFDLSGEATRQIERRRQERQAAFGGGSGAGEDQRGLGVGAAR